jgi:prevent-host-death family protein
MTKVTIHAAKTHLSKLIAKAEAGEEVVIYRGDKPAAKLVPVTAPARAKPRVPGRLKGVIGRAPAEVFKPMSPDEIALWEEGAVYPDAQR